MGRITVLLTGWPMADRPRPTVAHLAAPLVLTLAICGLASAQQGAGAPNDDDRRLIQQLLQRVSQLEAEVKDLKANQAQSASASLASPPSPGKKAETAKIEPAAAASGSTA